MLSWPDALCEQLAEQGRHVVRCDLRDAGASSHGDLESPDYTLRDLASDAAELARTFDSRPAHLAGIGISGMVAQVAALDHPATFSALTLIGTRAVAPGLVDDDLPDHDEATMGPLFSRLDCQPRWRERLPQLRVPTLVVHGSRDPFFPVGNGEALAREIPGARLIILEEASRTVPAEDYPEVAAAMAAL